MANADRQSDHSRESNTQKTRSRGRSLGRLTTVLVDGNLLSQGQVLGGQHESGRQERSDQNVNRFDDAHAEVSQSCQNTAILLPGSLGIKPPNSLTENEYGIIDRDSLPNLKQHRFLGSRRRLDGTGCSLCVLASQRPRYHEPIKVQAAASVQGHYHEEPRKMHADSQVVVADVYGYRAQVRSIGAATMSDCRDRYPDIHDHAGLNYATNSIQHSYRRTWAP